MPQGFGLWSSNQDHVNNKRQEWSTRLLFLWFTCRRPAGRCVHCAPTLVQVVHGMSGPRGGEGDSVGPRMRTPPPPPQRGLRPTASLCCTVIPQLPISRLFCTLYAPIWVLNGSARSRDMPPSTPPTYPHLSPLHPHSPQTPPCATLSVPKLPILWIFWSLHGLMWVQDGSK